MSIPVTPRSIRLLGRVVRIRAPEVPAALWSFAYYFCLLCSYYILRPVREEMGVAGGVERLPWIFTATFVAMAAAVPVFGALAARYPRRTLLPVVYGFFIANILGLFALLRSGLVPAWAPGAFFVWLSVFNLFVVSVFWSFMADLWSAAQARRLFGFIAAGGSAGALVGPSLTVAAWPPLDEQEIENHAPATFTGSLNVSDRFVSTGTPSDPLTGTVD